MDTAAIQWRFRSVQGPGELLGSLDLLVRRAAGEGASLVVLPPLLPLALMEPADLEDLSSRGGNLIGVRGVHSCWRAHALWVDVARELTTRHRVALVASTVLVPQGGGRLVHRAEVWGPDGRLVGAACQTHRSEWARRWGVAPAAEIAPLPVGGCTLGLLLDQDVRCPEVSRILALQGANLLVHLRVGTDRGRPAWPTDLWREVQANQVFGLEVPAAGGPLGPGGAGARILAPLGLDPRSRDGVLAATDGLEDGVVVGRLDFAALQRVVDDYPIFSVFNVPQYRRYFPAAYAGEMEGLATPTEPRARWPRGLLGWLVWGLCAGRARLGAALRALEAGDGPKAPPLEPGQTRVGVVQMEFFLAMDAADYLRRMAAWVAEAVAGGAQLVVFPEDSGAPLMGLLPGLRRLANRAESVQEPGGEEAAGPSPADLARWMGPVCGRVFEEVFSALARHYRVHIVAGSIMVPDRRGRVFNRGYFYGPDGRLIGTQDKTHLFLSEVAWGLTPGLAVRVFESDVGRVALPICMDHTFFEPVRIAWLQGAEIVVDPSANPETYDRFEQARGVWGRVQESPAYGVLACMVGEGLGFRFEGRSGVYAPAPLTPKGDGVLAEADTADRGEVVWADLDLPALWAQREEVLGALSVDLCRRYLPGVYEEYLRQVRKWGRRRVASPDAVSGSA